MSKLSKKRYYAHRLDKYKTPKDITNIEKAVYDLWADVTDRRGIGDEFDNCDDEVQEEIMNTWATILTEAKL